MVCMLFSLRAPQRVKKNKLKQTEVKIIPQHTYILQNHWTGLSIDVQIIFTVSNLVIHGEHVTPKIKHIYLVHH